jgi:hypothetical protein
MRFASLSKTAFFQSTSFFSVLLSRTARRIYIILNYCWIYSLWSLILCPKFNSTSSERPFSDSTVRQYVGFELKTVAKIQWHAVGLPRRSTGLIHTRLSLAHIQLGLFHNSARSHPHSARFYPRSPRSHPQLG